MTQAANELKLPIVASDEFSVKRGATAALGVNDYDFGRTTGKMVYRILNGESVSTITPEVMNNLTLYISPKHAKAQGVRLPADMLKDAINVDIQDSNGTETANK
jgi:putative ABC transport system substrate-binding protein